MVSISAAVEGLVDEVVISRLVAEVGGVLGTIYGKKGKSLLRERISGYNNAAKFLPWIVLVDLDRDTECAPELREKWIRDLAPGLCFRVAVREVEAWLLADRERIAQFLSVPISRIPTEPESVEDPKQLMISLAARSRRGEIREDMVPRIGSGRDIGPAYTSRLIEFSGSLDWGWRPRIAMKNSDSLNRTIGCLQNLIRRFSG